MTQHPVTAWIVYVMLFVGRHRPQTGFNITMLPKNISNKRKSGFSLLVRRDRRSAGGRANGVSTVGCSDCNQPCCWGQQAFTLITRPITESKRFEKADLETQSDLPRFPPTPDSQCGATPCSPTIVTRQNVEAPRHSEPGQAPARMNRPVF